MAQAILLSIVAGIASALLSGILSAGSVLGAVLFFLAPLPLVIVGIGWHPLVAALGGLIACTAVSAIFGPRIALTFGAMVALPAWLASEGVLRHFASGAVQGVADAGRRLGAGMLLPLAFYAALVTLVGALAISFDHQIFATLLVRVVDQAFRTLLSGQALPPETDLTRFAAIYAGMVPPVFTTILSFALTISLWLAVKITRKSGRLAFEPPPLFLTWLPREALFVFVGCLALTYVPGWLGFIGVVGTAALTFSFTLVGIAVVHMKTMGRTDRALLLGGVWASILIFTLPALIFAIVGAFDAVLDFRRLRGGGPSTPKS